MRNFLILFQLISFSLFGQVNLDSLKQSWENTSLSDSSRIASINLLAWEGYLFTAPDSSIYYAQLQYDFAKSIGSKKHMAVALNTEGTALYMLGQYAEATEKLYESLELKEEIKDIKGIAATLNNLAMINDENKNYGKAIDNYHQAIRYIKGSPDYEKNSELKKIITASYHNLGVLNIGIEKYDNAIAYLDSTVELAVKEDFKRELAYAYANIGRVYSEKDDFRKSLMYYQKGYEIIRDMEDHQGLVDAYNNFGSAYLELKDYDSAIFYCKKALSISLDTHLMKSTGDAAEILYESYKALNQSSKALDMLELNRRYEDSIRSLEDQELILQQQYKYEYEKKSTADSIAFAAKEEIQNLKISDQQSQIKAAQIQTALLVGIIVLFTIVLIISYRSYKRKLKNSEIITEQKKEVEKQRDKIKRQNDLLEEKNKEITILNNNLENLVKERTEELEKSLEQISSYQHDLAHNIRAPFVTLVGLLQLIKHEKFDSKDNQAILERLQQTSENISVVLQDISRELSKFENNIGR